VLLKTLRRIRAADHIHEMFGQHCSRTPYSVFHTDRPSSAEYDILSAEEEMPKQLGARLQLMSDDMGDHPVMIALPPGSAHAAVARWRRRSLNTHQMKPQGQH
jgi:hypothetical protein